MTQRARCRSSPRVGLLHHVMVESDVGPKWIDFLSIEAPSAIAVRPFHIIREASLSAPTPRLHSVRRRPHYSGSIVAPWSAGTVWSCCEIAKTLADVSLVSMCYALCVSPQPSPQPERVAS